MNLGNLKFATITKCGGGGFNSLLETFTPKLLNPLITPLVRRDGTAKESGFSLQR